jgi:hypothetical protein
MSTPFSNRPLSHRASSLTHKKNAAPRVRLQVEQLEDRVTPSATVVDLTTPGAAGMVNGAIVEQVDPQPTGCGVIHDFLRIESQGAKQTVEQGYNTDARPLQFDEKTSATFTHSIHLSDLPTTNINGVIYRVFLLGINQKHSSSLLSMDELRLYVSDSANVTGYDATTNTLGGLNPVYDMTSAGVTWVKLDSSLSHGNGSGDMLLFVPDQLFASTNPDPYVYLYSKFGVNYGTNGGFEQWAPATGLVPPPASLSGFVFQDNNNTGVFVPGTGIGSVHLILTGSNDLGQNVVLTTVTQPDGSFIFVGLRPGTYTITEIPPSGFTPGKDSVGTVNGVADGAIGSPTVLTNINLNFGQNGINYNFAELIMHGGS